MLNRVVLMGRLTRDPELRYTPQNVPVCTITLAVERAFVRQGEQRETDFIDVVAWRQTAEFVSKYFRKGLLVAVEGRLQSRKWKDKYEQNRVSFEVVADNVYFAERANDAQRSGDSGQPYLWTAVALISLVLLLLILYAFYKDGRKKNDAA